MPAICGALGPEAPKSCTLGKSYRQCNNQSNKRHQKQHNAMQHNEILKKVDQTTPTYIREALPCIQSSTTKRDPKTMLGKATHFRERNNSNEAVSAPRMPVVLKKSNTHHVDAMENGNRRAQRLTLHSPRSSRSRTSTTHRLKADSKIITRSPFAAVSSL